MCRNSQFLRDIPVTENLDDIESPLRQAFGNEHFRSHVGPRVKGIVDRADIDFGNTDGELIIVKSALSHPAEERHLTAFVTEVSRVASTALRAFVTTTGGLSVTRTDAATNAFPRFLCVNALMDVVDHHN